MVSTRLLVLALLFVPIGAGAQTRRFKLDSSAASPPFYFSVPLPEGNYNVTVTAGDSSSPTVTTIKAENRRLMVEKLTTTKGEFVTRTFTVHIRDSIIHQPLTPYTGRPADSSFRRLPPGTPVRLKPRESAYLHWDDNLTLEFSNTAPAIRSITIAPASDVRQVFLAGNSTVVDQAEEPWAAWGQMIPAFFQPGRIVIANYAESGETLKAFVGERRLAKLFSMAHPGDYLFIEFAHNDQKPGGNHLDPFTTYKEELSRYIDEARSRGMIPVLVTSMHRRSFDSSGHIINTLGDYPAAMREEAKEKNVPLIDLNKMSKQLYEAWGPEQSIHAFVHYPAHTFPGQDQELKDDTHFNAYGAYELAKCVVNGIKANIPKLAGCLSADLPTFDPAHPDPLEDFHLPMSGKRLTSTAQLQWPALTAQTKPWTRWWWMGSAVDRQNLTANMEKYQAAGLGGLELTPIYGVKGYEAHFVDYLSPQWMDLFSYTLREAKRLHLGLDMSTGTGWPFGGGPLIDSTYACRELFWKTWTLQGGAAFPDTIFYRQDPYVHTDGRPTTVDQLKEPVFANKDLQSLALFQVRYADAAPLQSLMAYSATGEVLDLTTKVDPTGHLNWTAPAGSNWTLYGLFLGWHGKMVERAAPGAEGNVIDHFSATALRKYLSRFDTAFTGHDLAPLRCFFNDSYEVDDSRGQSNWTAGFFAAFQKHRGYDLHQHLPALFGKDTKDNNTRVLCDFRETISDLLLEQFTKPWHDWAHTKGALIRNQAHGSPANILDLYAASDIPETEGQEILRYKFATSAAHTTGKPLASAETVTWLNEHFLSTYADVKKALDGFFLGGVNHVFYHGTAYTPMNDPWPGWLFYASVHFTPNDPAWPGFSALNQYVARCQSFLQQGAPDNDILLYYPIYDSWSDPGNSLLKHYDRMDPEFSGTGFRECAEFLQNHGYAFDYISDKQLQQPLPAQYKTVLLPAAHYLPLATLQHLVELSRQGVTILVYKTLPSGPPGNGDLQKRTAAFNDLLAKNTFTVGDELNTLLTTAHTRRETLVDDSLGFVRRTYGNSNVYFIVNHSTKPFIGYAPLADSSRRRHPAAIFDPMTGEKGLARQKGQSVYLQLDPGESCLIETNIALRGPLFPYYQAASAPRPLQGDWHIEFLSGGPTLPGPANLRQPGPWTTLDGDEHKAFSGTARYTLSFAQPTAILIPPETPAWRLDLGTVARTAEVSLNGKRLATLIGPYYQVIIPAAAIQPRNTLEIIVSGGMVNRIIDMDRKGIPWKKFYNYNFPAHERANRGANGLFDASKWTPEEEGLIGPVTLTALQPVARAGDSPSGQKTLANADPDWTNHVGARSLPASTTVFPVTGADKTGATLATKAIQSTIDVCAAKGGGIVTLEPGIYLTGSIFLREGVDLHIGKDVELRGSQRFEDYPDIDTRIAGIEMKWPAALLNIIGVKNAAITGEGTVNARGKFCWDKYWAMRKEYDAKGLRWIVDYDAKRVRTLLIQGGEDITVKGLKFVDAGFWTVQVLYSTYITVDGITVRNNEDGHGPSTDGVDIDSSSWVLVENCDIDCNDDDFCLKAGRDWDGLRVDRPTEYVVIRHCTARKGGGLLTIGSETSGGIRHVLATDLKAKGTGNGFHIKSATTRGGTVEDIHIRNITMDSVGNAILFTMNWNPAYSYSTLPAGYNPDSIPPHWKTMLHKVEPAEKGIPHFKNIYISGITVASARKAISATGLEQSLITGVHIDNMTINAATAGDISFAKDWQGQKCAVTAKDGSKIQVKNSANVTFN